MFKTLTRAALLGLTLTATPIASWADEAAIDAATKDKLTADLTAQGYDVRKMEAEDGMIEVYAVKEDKAWELYFDAELALVKSCNDGTCEGADAN